MSAKEVVVVSRGVRSNFVDLIGFRRVGGKVLITTSVVLRSVVVLGVGQSVSFVVFVRFHMMGVPSVRSSITNVSILTPVVASVVIVFPGSLCSRRLFVIGLIFETLR